jgi:regulator of sirC expression with transglutaminase-like and TPR domain
MQLKEIGLCDDEDIDLIEAGIALSLADRPDDADIEADAARLRRLVSGWAMAINRDIAPTAAGARARRLAGIIAGEARLTGATEDYDHPLNADLVAVAKRGRGLPVALSILYVALARRVGWRADALNLPGHVIVEVHGQGEPALIDPFDHGMGLTRARALDIARHGGGVESGGGSDGRFPPLGNRALLVRLLSNQAARARGSGNSVRALTLFERMTLIAPAMPALWWERARLEQLIGRVGAAKSSLIAMLETTRDETLRRRIEAAIASLARSEN